VVAFVSTGATASRFGSRRKEAAPYRSLQIQSSHVVPRSEAVASEASTALSIPCRVAHEQKSPRAAALK
jgi:hypothetical protein